MRLGIVGVAGRMGRALIQSVDTHPETVVSGGTERPGSDAIGVDMGTLTGTDMRGLKVTEDLDELIAASDSIIEFSSPAATVANAAKIAAAGKIHIIGTTGLSSAEDAAIAGTVEAGACIVKAGNMSLGLNLLTALTRKVAEALDADFDIEIVEMHHRHKVDAPSGTALMLGEAAAAGRDVNLSETSVRVRDGQTGERRRGDIGFATLRGGTVVGEHAVVFAGPEERIVLSHIATDRAIFANGAVRAALWARGKPPGLYTMFDVLGLN